MSIPATCLALLLAIAAVAVVATPAGAVPPEAATPLAPAGTLPTGPVTFTWQAGAGATFYYLQVNDATASPRFTAWYPAGQACPAGSATCLVTVTTGWAVGAATWWVQTWNADGFGPWSVGMGFSPSHVAGAWSHDLPAGQRFQLVFGGNAVLDRVTGLVWERAPLGSLFNWQTALHACHFAATASRVGWRLPRLEELQSLQDLTESSPRLPAGHPFTVFNTFYWSATTYAADPTQALAASFHNIDPSLASAKSTLRATWCVTGGQTSQAPQ